MCDSVSVSTCIIDFVRLRQSQRVNTFVSYILLMPNCPLFDNYSITDIIVLGPLSLIVMMQHMISFLRSMKIVLFQSFFSD